MYNYYNVALGSFFGSNLQLWSRVGDLMPKNVNYALALLRERSRTTRIGADPSVSVSLSVSVGTKPCDVYTVAKDAAGVLRRSWRSSVGERGEEVEQLILVDVEPWLGSGNFQRRGVRKTGVPESGKSRMYERNGKLTER